MSQDISDRLKFASLVVGQLNKFDVSCVLVGGACVSIYTNEKFHSNDLDFISPNSKEVIAEALEKIGFYEEGKYFVHKDYDFYVEFPSGPISIGDSSVKAQGVKDVNGIKVKMLSPTQSVMDRLAAWSHWDDRISLIQAIEIARQQKVNFKEIENWCKKENMKDKYDRFMEQLKLTK